MRPRQTKTKRSDSGFTLLEILVGLVIMASTVTAVMQSFSAAANAQYRAARLQRAAQIAEARLAILSETAAARASVLEGSASDGYRWRETVTPLTSETYSVNVALVELRIAVFPPGAELDAPDAVLTTIRLGAELANGDAR